MSWDLVALVLAAITLPGTLELAFLTISAWVRLPPASRKGRRNIRKLAVVVPAHDEAATITPTLHSLQNCAPATVETTVVVVADNCSDQTAEIAADAGIRVLVRNDPARRGKGYALDYAFRTLLTEGYNAFIIVDADTQVESNLLQSFAEQFNGGAEALQCLYRAPEHATSPAVRMRNIIWYAFNVLRPRARAAWGLSVGIYGNGFGVTRAALQRVPYNVGSITEDLDYHLRLIGAGMKVELVPDTTVWSALPVAAAAVESQRARWEGGRLAAILEWSPRLIKRIARGHWSAVEPLLDLWLLPLSYHALLLLPLLPVPSAAGRLYAAFGLFLLAFHAFSAVRLSGRWQDLAVLIRIPVYVFGKLRILPQILAKSGKNATWIRTDRSTAGEKS